MELPDPLSPQDLLEGVSFRVEGLDERGVVVSRGTAFAVAKNLLATAAHVVVGAASIRVLSTEGSEARATVAHVTQEPKPKHRAALLTVDEALARQRLPLLGSEPPRARAHLSGFGFEVGDFGEGGQPFLLEVVGQSKTASIGGTPLLKVQGGRLGPGHSGAPVLDWATGRVCGMVVTSNLKGQGHLYPVQLLRDIDAAVVESQLNADLIRWWIERLADDQIREAAIAFPTRELLRYVRLAGGSRSPGPLNSLMVGEPHILALHDVYENQSLLLRSTARDFSGSRTAAFETLLYGRTSFAIVAPAGGGKSSALAMARSYAAEAVEDNDYRLIAIQMHASDLTSTEPIFQAILKSLSKVPVFTDQKWTEQFFVNPPVLGGVWTLLVDGLDEIVDPLVRQALLVRLAGLVEGDGLDGRPTYRVILASRPLPELELSALASAVGSVWALQPLERPQRLALLGRWFPEERARRHAVEVLDRFEDEGAPELLGSPLFLTIACQLLIRFPESPLPRSRSGLVSTYFESLRDRFYRHTETSTRRQLMSALEPYGASTVAAIDEYSETIYQRLAKAAFTLVASGTADRGDIIFDEEDGFPIANVSTEVWRAFCEELWRRTGLVHQNGKRLQFSHQVITEYLAAWLCAQDARWSEHVLNVALDAAQGYGPLANHSFIRFVSPAWLRADRFTSTLTDRIRSDDVAAIELAVAIMAEDPGFVTRLEDVTLTATRRVFADAMSIEIGVRMVSARISIGGPAVAADLYIVSRSRIAHPAMRVWAFLSCHQARHARVRVLDPYDSAWTEEKKLMLRSLLKGDGEARTVARLLTEDERISFFDRAELLEALEELGDSAPVRQSRVRSRLVRLGSRSHLVSPDLEPVLRAVRAHHPRADTSAIERAYQVAEHAHGGQQYRNGGPHVTHAAAVALILAELGMTPPTLAAALLHDTLEHTAYRLEDLRSEFGEEIALLVDGVTKLDRVSYGTAPNAEILRAIMAIARDIRVLVIKLADRLHNARTWEYVRAALAQREAREVLEIYAPLAQRLGMSSVERQLEDLSFATLYPKVYDEIVNLVVERFPAREECLATVRAQIETDLRSNKIRATVTGRVKHYYSVYRNTIVLGRDFDDILDLVGVRILVDSVKDCYAVLGTIHARWNPLPGRFKDHIAMPTFNLYQSIHTTVVGPGGKPVEIQIRTHDMHRRAEYGVAAHWKHKEDTGSSRRGDEPATTDMGWLRRLVDWQRETADPGEFLDSLRLEISGTRTYVFTPKGDVIALAPGATPVDFAYAVHTEVGHRAVGARVNGRVVPLESTLENGDTVEIFTSKAETAGPSRDWLRFVTSRRARKRIRAWFTRERREEAIEAGKSLIAEAMRE